MVDRTEIKPLIMAADRTEILPGLVDHLDPVYVQPEHPPWVQVLERERVSLLLGMAAFPFLHKVQVICDPLEVAMLHVPVERECHHLLVVAPAAGFGST